MTLQIETLPTAALTPYARNARTHSPEQVAQIAASIREFGFTNPVLIDAEGGIIAGHGRVMAANRLGLADVPCIRLAHLSDAQRRAYVIADNQLALNAGWDEALLAVEIGELKDMDFDLDLTGLGMEEIERLLAFNDPPPPPPDGADDVPEVQPDAITQPGDIWLLGKHRIMCGDSTDADSVKRLMAGEMADLVMTDPPYGINVVGGSKSFGTVGGSKSFGTVRGSNIVAANRYQEIIGDDTVTTSRKFYETCLNLGFIDFCMWGGNYFTEFLPPKKAWIVWDKKGRQWDDNFSDFELAWSSFDKPAKIFTHVWMGIVQSGQREKRQHPTQKPAAMIGAVIDYLKEKANLVFDGFLGSGSTLMACEQTGRRCYAMELSPQYVEVAVKRWQQYTGQTAILEATGQPFPANP